MMIKKTNLPELDYETPFRFGQNHEKSYQHRVAPKYAIENLKTTHKNEKLTVYTIWSKISQR